MLKKYSLLLAISVIWGSQFLLNHWVLAIFSPDALAVGRAAIGAVILNLWVLISRRVLLSLRALQSHEPQGSPHSALPLHEATLPVVMSDRSYWIKIQWIAFLEATLPFLLISWGQVHVQSAITSVLMASIALFTVIWVLLFVKEESISLTRIVALLIGFGGILILFLPQLKSIGGAIWHELAILGGALCFSLSMILIRKLGPMKAPVSMARDILTSAAIQLLLWTWMSHSVWLLHPLTWRAGLSLLFLGVFAGGVVYVLYVKLISEAGATFTGLVNYIVPIMGVGLGVTVLHEPLTWNMIVALVLLLLAMVGI